MHGRQNNSLPQARRSGLLVEHVGSEAIVYDVESSKAHCLKPVAAAVFARCDGETSVAGMSELVAADLGEAVDAEVIEDALAQLREVGLLVTSDAAVDGVSRRQMLRRTAVAGGAAMAAPLIASALTPTAALANGGTSVCSGSCCYDTDCHPAIESRKCACQKQAGEKEGICVVATS